MHTQRGGGGIPQMKDRKLLHTVKKNKKQEKQINCSVMPQVCLLFGRSICLVYRVTNVDLAVPDHR